MRKIIMASITAVVVIAVLAGTLVPILDDATTTETTFTNEGIWRMKAIESGDSWTLDSGTWTYGDDDSITYSSANAGSNIVLGDDWCVRAVGQARGHTIGGNPTDTVAIAGDSNVTISGTGINGSTTQSLTGYGYDPNGDYAMTAYNQSSYMNGDSRIYATGSSYVDGVYVIIHIEGTIDDDVTITVESSYSNSGTPTISDVVITNKSINYTEVDGYDDLYELESVTFDLGFNLTLDETTTAYEGAVSYSSYVVPYEVTAEKSVHFTDGENAILKAIPVIVIIALLLGVVAIVLRSRMD